MSFSLCCQKGARIDQRDALGITALNMACVKEDVAMAKFSLDSGANPLAMNRAGWTPAFTAKYHDKPDSFSSSWIITSTILSK